MKNLIKILFLLTSLNILAQSEGKIIPPKVDKRLELLSIVFRLADIEEYSADVFPSYINDIENHYGRFKNHELIKYIKLIREENGIAYDAVPSFAVNVTDPPNMKPIIPFSSSMLDARWGEKTATEFLKLLNRFYDESDSESFFKDQVDLYQLTSQSFKKVYEDLNQQWYESFYGQKPKGEYRMVNAVGIGPFNYGAKVVLTNGKEIIYAIIGVSEFDDSGAPEFSKDAFFPTVLHEFNHSFVNHLVKKFKPELKNSGEVIYKHLGSKMKKQRYGNWQTMFSEALVRASVIKYLMDNNETQAVIDQEINEQMVRGFIWTKDLVTKLERYSNHRDIYPTLEDFMPEIVRFFEHNAQIIDEKTPVVLSISPFANNATNVDSESVKKITVSFDKELIGKSHSFNPGQKGKSAFPKISHVKYSDDKKSVSFDVNLEPNKEYQIVLTGLGFKSVDGYELADFEIHFKTK